jgi:hypothetical protein
VRDQIKAFQICSTSSQLKKNGQQFLWGKGVYLWLEASPYTGIGYKNGDAEGDHKVTVWNFQEK